MEGSMTLQGRVRELLSQIEVEGLYKRERVIASAQAGRIRVVSQSSERELINLCANNYLGLADHPEIIAAAKRGLDEFGCGMASVRFICGTQTLHRELERTIAHYLDKDDAILFAACFDDNGGAFEPLLEADDAIISDSRN
jgi:glycine C-acetyltransferase